MRAGGCTVQQSLTSEAANVVKQAVGLARRRGHAQVTPLHVANTMLSTSTGLFRTACLQSRSHPLQCRALELCFNVALNRLPASTSSPMLGPHQHHPSISNALVAAFRRAQAHQRRGSIESQQQPLLAVKIELEQLIISILDDPSVSRVMREAGFSSTQVKTNVEQATETQTSSKPNNNTTSDPTKIDVNDEDVLFVIDNMVKRAKSTVIVGDSVASMEGVVRGVMEKIDKGDVDETLRGVKFVNLSVVSFARLARDEVERKLEELRRLVNSYMAGGGVVLFLGDLKWTAEFWSTDRRITNLYCPVEHVVMEIGKLVSRVGENKRFRLIGIATFHTYQTCKTGHLSLETVWCLSPLTIPSRSLRLSLIPNSDEQSGYLSKKGQNGSGWPLVDLDGDDDEEKQLNCCPECSAKYESEAQSLRNRASSDCNSDKSSSTLPAWLQHYKNQNKPPSTTANDQGCVSLKDLGKKWSSICSSIHRHHRQSHDYSEKTLTFSSVMSPSSTFSYHQDNPNPYPYPVLHRNMSWPQHIMNHSWTGSEPSTVPEPAGPNPPPPFSSSAPTSACSGDPMEVEYVHKFQELNAETLKTLCDALDKTVPSHKLIVPEIAAAILRCRSGLVRRKENHPKEDTWLFFLGADVAAKETVARELARLVFGSRSRFVSVALSSFSSDQDRRNKRSRSRGYVERFADEAAEDPRRVFFVEDVEQADWCSRIGFRRAVEKGRVTGSGGEEVVLRDAIVVLSCERFGSRSRGCSSDEEDGKNGNCNVSSVSLDLNMSIDDDGVDDCDIDHSIDDIGLVEAVDARVVFKLQDL